MDLLILIQSVADVASQAADAAQTAEPGIFAPTGMIYKVCGWIATLGLIFGYVPQAWQTMRTRRTDDIALPTFLMIGIGGIAFMLQGAMLGVWNENGMGEGFALFFTNLITTVCSVIIFGIKIYNDYIKKK
ncbi:MAG: PQ-loop repeat-containing protein [Muribaculaceae bacterium]|nr:PQ-loop repeat-containing protein [Muribaculaceae bacterium]